MRVLFLTGWYPNKFDVQNGIFVRKHAMAVSRYCEVNLLYITRDKTLNKGYVIRRQTTDNFTEWTVYYKGSRFLLLHIYLTVMLYRKMIASIRRVKGVEDLIHINVLGKKDAIIALMQWWQNKIPYILTEHWTGYMNERFRQKNFIEKLILRHAAKKAKAITTVSEELKNAMLQCGLRNNYFVIPNVVESVPDVPVREKDKNVKVFLTVSDLADENKNISGTIHAVSRIAAKRNDFEFHIIGGGADEEALKKLATDLNLINKRVFFHGRHTNDVVLNLMNRADFVVVNSNVETFSVVAAEALASGKPVIATICGGPETFINDATGILIEKRNNTQLETAILKMLDTFQNYKKAVLRASVIEKFGSETIGKTFYELYKLSTNTN